MLDSRCVWEGSRCLLDNGCSLGRRPLDTRRAGGRPARRRGHGRRALVANMYIYHVDRIILNQCIIVSRYNRGRVQYEEARTCSFSGARSTCRRARNWTSSDLSVQDLSARPRSSRSLKLKTSRSDPPNAFCPPHPAARQAVLAILHGVRCKTKSALEHFFRASEATHVLGRAGLPQ